MIVYSLSRKIFNYKPFAYTLTLQTFVNNFNSIQCCFSKRDIYNNKLNFWGVIF